jgi:hypothetical protein
VYPVATARAASLATTRIRPGLPLVSVAGLNHRRDQAYLGSQILVSAYGGQALATTESWVYPVATARAASLATTRIRPGLPLVSAAGLSHRRDQAYLGSQMSVMAGNSAGGGLRCDCSLARLLDARLLEITRLASSLLTEMAICSSAKLVGHLAHGSICNLEHKSA